MNILFMSLSDYRTISFNGMYTNLLRQFINNGDDVYLLSPYEKRDMYEGNPVIKEPGSTIIKFGIGNIQKTNIFEKGINTVTIESKYKNAIKRYLSKIRFDLVLYPTPPITLLKAVGYVKERDGAKTYLLLKDIFPQNAVDIGLLRKKGPGRMLYRYFRKKEKKFYGISDRIGCMSKANVEYIISHNEDISPSKVGVCPNTIDTTDMSCTNSERQEIRGKYGIPLNKIVFVYGGNLGKPQGVSFIIECLRKCSDLDDVYFLIVGAGTEYKKIEDHISKYDPANVRLMKSLPKYDYDRMIGSCDVGLIFLDHRFTIPNFPSRILSYMAAKLPVLACTDRNTDIGEIIVTGGFGYWCESISASDFKKLVERMAKVDRNAMGVNGYKYMCENYSDELGYKIINDWVKGGELS